MAGTNDKDNAGGQPPAAPKKVVRVRVICEGVLGKKLLPKGTITSDPAYVALLGDPRNVVEEVK